MMNEILTCIKLIKMYAWESSFAKAISGRDLAITFNCRLFVHKNLFTDDRIQPGLFK